MNLNRFIFVLLTLFFNIAIAEDIDNKPAIEMHVVSLLGDVRSYMFSIKISKKDNNLELNSYLQERLSEKLEDFVFYLPHVSNKDYIQTICSGQNQMVNDFVEMTENCTSKKFKKECDYFNQINLFCYKNKSSADSPVKSCAVRIPKSSWNWCLKQSIAVGFPEIVFNWAWRS